MKDNKLVRFFNTVNFNIDFTGFFEEASLKEVLLDKKNNKMTMIIEMDNLVPLEVFKELCEKGKTLEGAEKVRFKFIIKIMINYFLNTSIIILIFYLINAQCLNVLKEIK